VREAARAASKDDQSINRMGAPMFNFQSCAAAGLAFFVAFGGAQADTIDKLRVSKTLHLGYRTNSIPFSYVEGSEPVGYAADVCRHFAAALTRELKLPLQITWLPIGPNERTSALVDGLIDIDCADSVVTNQSLKDLSFTIPIFIAATRLLVPGPIETTDLGRFRGKKVVTTSQSGNEAMLRHVLGQTGVSAEVVVTRTSKAALEALKKGQAQALFADDATLFAIRLNSASAGYSVLPKVYSMRPKAIAFRKDEPRLGSILSREMRALITSGALARSHDQWLNSALPGSGVNLGVPVGYLLRETWKNPSNSFVDHAYGHFPD
jgi:ABC-type amino acid transport substrate-binding protein